MQMNAETIIIFEEQKKNTYEMFAQLLCIGQQLYGVAEVSFKFSIISICSNISIQTMEMVCDISGKKHK